MKQRKVGDLEVSAIGFGSMGLSFGLGPATDKREAVAPAGGGARERGDELRGRPRPFAPAGEVTLLVDQFVPSSVKIS